jgi:PHD/YefM family antitoxin component YafN of YafNO toxin-antitoxin module
MDDFDQQPLARAPEHDTPPPPTPRSHGTTIAVIAVLGLLLGGAGAWWWTRTDSGAAPAAVTGSSPTAGTEAAVGEPTPPLPPLSQMDTYLRALLGTLSAHPDFVRWLATDDLIRQLAHGIDRLSRGQSPASDLAVLRPTGDFGVAGRRDDITIDPASFRRYDRHVALLESLDPQAVVNAYHTIHPRLDEAYRGLGRAEGGVDTALRVALKNLIEAPIPQEPIAVVPGRGSTYAYSEAEYERLSAAQKQLLRMGPAHARRVQARLREIQAALEASPPPASR